MKGAVHDTWGRLGHRLNYDLTRNSSDQLSRAVLLCCDVTHIP